MADPAMSSEAAVAGEGRSAPAGASEPARSRLAGWEASIRRRFGVAYLVLAAALGASVGLFIVLAGRPASSETSWSTWRPTERGLAGAAQIARYVSARYRLANGDLLVGVFAGRPEVQQDVPITYVQIRSGFPDEQTSGVETYKTDNSVMYQLCGSGNECSIPGAASIPRAKLLRREVLELSLFTFRYVGGVDSVIALTPPTFLPGSQTPVRTAVFLRRADVKAHLDVPLGQTLPQRTVHVPGSLSTAEERIVDRVRMLQYQFQGLPDGTAVLILTQFAA